ncbi:hypothetical protein C8R14_10270 [Nitrosomonas eutropha]|uniref:Transposase n=1 Tax=Nitrosomonas eutropha TaxID=916 RepID=A0ABX5M9R9_9PROT|nr:hypothetical protein C8R14_10270 [Nitrosomonas eutropha]
MWRDGVTSGERERIKAMEREIKELRRANDILKTANAFFAQAALDHELKKETPTLISIGTCVGSS